MHNTAENADTTVEEDLQKDICQKFRLIDMSDFIKILFFKLLSLYHAMGHENIPPKMFVVGNEILHTSTIFLKIT